MSLAAVDAWLDAAASRTGLRTLCVLSLGEGRYDGAVVTAGLGRLRAGRGQRVCAVDADFRLASLAAIDEAFSGTGLADLLEGRADFARALRRDSLTRLHGLGAGAGSDGQALVESVNLNPVLAALARSYELIVVNAGPLTTVNLSLALRCDAVLVLAADARLEEARDIRDALSSSGPKAVAIVRLAATAEPATADDEVAA